MSRGFGSTLGAGTTDVITSALTAKAALRSYHVSTYRNGDGGVGVGRVLDASGGAVLLNNSGTTYSFSQAFSGSGPIWTVARPSASAWHGVGVSYDGSNTTNDPLMYLNGVSQTVSEVTAPVGTINVTAGAYSLGNRASDGARNWDGMLAEFAVWDAILTADEFAALGKGISPALIRPQSLVEYVPMLRDNVSAKLAAPSITGTVVNAHPRVIYPSGSRVVTKGAVVAGSTQPPRSYHQFQMRRAA